MLKKILMLQHNKKLTKKLTKFKKKQFLKSENFVNYWNVKKNL